MKITNKPGVKTILLDMDGVLWRGDEPVLDIRKLFVRIKEAGLTVYCITNNSARTIEYYLQKLEEYGVNLNRDQIITSAEAASTYLLKIYPQGGNVYIVGEEGLIETLKRNKFNQILEPDQNNIIAVVVGLDRNLTYKKLAGATQLVANGVPFIGTNPDKSIPIPMGIAPGAGSVISAIETASGINAAIIGKPEKHVFQLALDRANCLPSESIMIGDRLDTDILGAQNIGIQTGLVLSGVTSKKLVESWDPVPTFVADNAAEILEMII